MISRLYLYLLFALFAVFLLSLSIQYTDTDLWYHMTGGKHFLTNGEFYNPFVSSYIERDESFINYFWMFQVFIYSAHAVAGYSGLVVLKAVLFLLCAFLLAKLVLENKPFATATFLQLLVISLVISVLCYRGFSLRPHLFSYCFIPLFIYILMYHEKLYGLLPLLAFGWINYHGVEYVVGALICGSFFLTRLIDYVEGNKEQLKPMLWIASCLPAMMINPHGIYVMLTPFITGNDLDRFILELEPLKILPVLDFSRGITLNTLVITLLGFWIAAAVTCLKEYRTNLAPLLLAIGGLILLATGKRFIWEWMLLSTPMIAIGLRNWRVIPLDVRTFPVLTLYLVVLTVTFYPATRNGWQHYPIDEHSLPYGTTQFIKEMNIPGRYAVEPTYAGYVEFHLAPDIQVHSDMQFPPFTNMDYFEIATAMRTPSGLKDYIKRYRPDLLGVMKANQAFPDGTARAEGYVPVFFDQKVVLYIDSNKYPSIAKRHALNNINPYLQDQIPVNNLEAGITELENMITVVDMPEVRLTLVGMLIEQRDLKKADLYLDDLREAYPQNSSVQYFTARVYHLQQKYLDAVPHYEASIRSSTDNKQLHLQAAECYFLIGDQHSAYDHFSAGLNPYTDRNPVPLTYYQYALSAYGTGRTQQAKNLLEMIQRFDADSELAKQVSELLDQLNEE